MGLLIFYFSPYNSLMHILLADDHDLFREGIRLILQRLDDIAIYEASNREEIEHQLHQNPSIDILLLDLNMPGVGSAKSVKEICTSFPKLAVIVISGNDSTHTIETCLQAGAAGFVPKDSSREMMLSAIHIVYGGGKFIPSKAYSNCDAYSLSHRQKEIYELIIEGQSNKKIASHLNISESTVKQHITELFRKLNVSGRVQAILKAGATLP